MADKHSPKNSRQKDAVSLTKECAPDVASEEVTEALPRSVLTGRHWPKYAGIGESRQNRGGSPPAAGENITSLGSLEAELLGILWEIGRPATGMEVMEVSLYSRCAQGQEPAAFATIATTLRRLAGKGLLGSQKNDSRSPLYWPKVGREQMAARLLNKVSQTLLGTSLHGLLPKLIGRSPEEAGSTEEGKEIQMLMDALEQVAKADAAELP